MVRLSAFYLLIFVFCFTGIMSRQVSAQDDITTLHGVKWKVKTGGAIHSSPVGYKNMLFCGSSDGYLYALKIETGEEVWTFNTQGDINSTPLVHKDLVYVHSMNQGIYAIDVNSGRLIWKFYFSGEETVDLWDYYQSSPYISEGILYVGSGNGYFYALDAKKGELKWNFKTDGAVNTSPVTDSVSVYFGSYNGYFYSLNKKNGNKKWRFNTVGQRYFPKGAVQCGATLSGGILYFGSRDFNLYALDAKTGTGMWNYYEQGSWVIATPVIKDNFLLFGTSDSRHFYAMDKRSGKILWVTETQLNVFGSCAVGEKLAYFGCLNGGIYAISLENGERVWEFTTKKSEENYSLIFNSEGKIHKDIYNRFENNIYKVYGAIHSLGSVLSTPLLQDQTLYFGAMDGYIYAVY